MIGDLGTLRVEKVIVHDIPRRPVRETQHGPLLSDMESPLTPELRNYFRERMTASLARAAFSVVFDTASASPIPRLVETHLTGEDTDFVGMSHKIARHLYECQTGVNPAGLLCIVQASISGNPGLGVLKLEREAGIRLEQATQGGKSFFNLEHLRDLMLTQKTRVFKVGLFSLVGGEECPIVGAVSDNQRGFLPATEVADFFLHNFLGCQLVEAPEVSTKKFVQLTEGFIEKEIDKAEVKTRYELALLAEMNKETGTVSPKGFAADNFRTEDRQRYIEWLEEGGLVTQPFPKDIALVKGRLARVQMDFRSGISVMGSADTFDEHVSIEDMDDGRTHIEITDKVERVRGKR